MSRELWAVETCVHGSDDECKAPTHGAGRYCNGGSRTLLDFDTIWDRYYEIRQGRHATDLTKDELRKVIGLEEE